jgi:hypothetical protein
MSRSKGERVALVTGENNELLFVLIRAQLHDRMHIGPFPGLVASPERIESFQASLIKY